VVMAEEMVMAEGVVLAWKWYCVIWCCSVMIDSLVQNMNIGMNEYHDNQSKQESENNDGNECIPYAGSRDAANFRRGHCPVLVYLIMLPI